MERAGVRLPVIEAQCEYKRPARYDDELEIRVEGEVLSPVRMAFTYTIVTTKSDEPLAIGRTAHAAVGLDGRPCRLPDRVLAAFR
jgi:acyl-CoA thioester hydrolase